MTRSVTILGCTGSVGRSTVALLEEAPEGEEILFDYASTGFTLRRHPLALLRWLG